MPGRLEGLLIPEHIAIILDGNGRWAERRKLPRAAGHKAGCEAVEQTVRDCAAIGVKYLTVYGFSTENWKRSEDEVSALMQLFRFYLKKLLKVAKEENCRCLMIGDKERFAPDIVQGIDRLVRETENNTGMTFIIAINYGGRDEIRRAVQKILRQYRDQPFDIEKTADIPFVADHLDTAGIPDPDLLIRTSGELRVSNFLLWQIAYSEIYVTDLLWPDFNMHALEDAVIAYNGRERRFGGRKG
jgi:undecaprenyl diphosphate synthase